MARPSPPWESVMARTLPPPQESVMARPSPPRESLMARPFIPWDSGPPSPPHDGQDLPIPLACCDCVGGSRRELGLVFFPWGCSKQIPAPLLAWSWLPAHS
ncbi:unnamed protein product [Eretmochelys imbricata]